MYSKNCMLILVASICFTFAIISESHAIRLLTPEEALENSFPGCEFETETKVLDNATQAIVKSKLGGELVHFNKNSKSAKVNETYEFTFRFAKKNGQKVGVAIVDVEPGKWGPIEFIISLDMSGKIKRVEVMSYSEKRGRPIATRNFMAQYENKKSTDPIKVASDITGVTGATVSSEAACFAVRKILFIYETLYKKSV